MDLEAIRKHNLIFVSAQPDQLYFHWQVELYLYQFAKHGIQDQCYAIFGYRDKPSEYVQELAKKYKGVRLYKDTRPINIPNYYIPSIRPHILKQFFAENPSLGKNVFYHDSDIFLVKLPEFSKLLEDDIGYLSDTVSYIGYKYITDCAKRYSDKYPECPKNEILTKMCEIAKIEPSLLEENDANSGGAQYLLKNIDGSFWEEVEILTNSLYSMMCDYEKKYTLDNPIQKWTADMWGVLWTYWKRGNKTIVHSTLSFSWATSTVADYFNNPIFHLAGVTEETSKDKFYKGKYINQHICKVYMKNKSVFDHISPNNATYEYVQIIKEYAEALPPAQFAEPKRFLIETKESWASVYNLDTSTKICDHHVWRSADKKYIIFFNNMSWTLTAASYEAELKAGSGGFAFCSGDVPYENNWNVPCTIQKLDGGVIVAPT